ncbi:acetoacetate--CoA ligase [Sphingopyxis sp. 113P3]|uniref:acetoacetate--CoA ligase n=1 Tax=Sphingopyxis sp. (strain 113P3) TaxID=292913 RepID=UPI0006AD1314|nr:acetoacetate--CoA ligase [Sphingopyxis sp. 113P3]ALC11471.1 acetoacetyl-CoA synthetase [Sphingopyxis sp. 113P3]
MTSPSDSAALLAPVPQMRLYCEWLKAKHGLAFATYEDLRRWSVDDLGAFWRSIWDWDEMESPTSFTSVLSADAMPRTRWFEGAHVNYARHLFRHVDAAEAAGQPAIIAVNETGEREILGWAELRRQAASLALELRSRGIEKGDRVAAYLPNISAAVVGLLACASLGAVWTLCSPDMGTSAVLDRLRQTRPKALIAVDGVLYGGKAMDRSAAVAEIRAELPCAETLFILRSGYGAADVPDAHDLKAALGRDDSAVAAFEPEWLPFDHPLWILYSSGTTGLPKPIVHGHGGVLIATAAGRLHFDLGPSYSRNNFGERFHWYSATGWVMWNIQVGGLLSGTTICLFDGSPSGTKLAPDWSRLWTFAVSAGVTWFGAGAAFFSSARKAGLKLADIPGIKAIRALGSTGSPLPPDVQRWGSAEFKAAGRDDIWWCNVSGGTEIAAAFLAGNPELADTPGRLQCRHLGAAIEAWDEKGEPVIGEVGELVCTRPFPSMPLYFWGDEDGARYREAYFSHWPGVWRHGDWLTIGADGGCTISGRSDATINRHGLRMGTAEIYAAVEGLPAVDDAMIIDVEDDDGDSKLIMFVVPAEGHGLDPALEAGIASAIRTSLSPRFVPDCLIAAPAVPMTLSGKKQELPIKRLFAGWPAAKVINADATATPEVLPWYIDQARQWRESKARATPRGSAKEADRA